VLAKLLPLTALLLVQLDVLLVWLVLAYVLHVNLVMLSRMMELAVNVLQAIAQPVVNLHSASVLLAMLVMVSRLAMALVLHVLVLIV